LKAARSCAVNTCAYAQEATMAQGKVKFFNHDKGYGFIQPNPGQGSKDVFVHVTALERAGIRSLNEGQEVSYEISMDRGKEAATNLQLV
jgi:CspA family cold shock protein